MRYEVESMICNYQRPMQKTNDTESSDADNDVASKGKKLFLHNKPLLVVSIFSGFFRGRMERSVSL